MSHQEEEAKGGKTTRAVAVGVLKLGELEIDCYVLDDETRVLSQASIYRALTGATGSADLSRYTRRLPAKYAALTVRPVLDFTMPKGGRAKGRSSVWFIELLRAYNDAFINGELHAQQQHLGRQANALLMALAGVGLDALVDEATGYQHIRKSAALSRLFDHYLRSEAAKWQLMWPPEIIGSICKALRLTYDGKGCPPWFGEIARWVYTVVLGQEVYGEMRKRNPRTVGEGNSRHHQFLTDSGRVVTQRDLEIVKGFADQASGPQDFRARVNRFYLGTPLQLQLH